MKRTILLTSLLLLIFSAFSRPGYLGVVISDYSNGGINGVRITETVENGAAWKHGIRNSDVITAVNGQAVQGKHELIDLVSKLEYGDKVKLELLRDNKLMTETVKLGNQPVAHTIKISKSKKADGEHWRFEMDKTEIVVNEKNIPVAVFTWDDNGVIKATADFSVFEDKFGYISKIQQGYATCNCACPVSQYTFYKITPDTDVEEVAEKQLPVSFDDKFTITPNPSSGRIQLNISSNERGTPTLIVYDIHGEVIQTEILQNFVGQYTKEYHFEDLPKGAYLVQLKIGDKLSTRKFILQ